MNRYRSMLAMVLLVLLPGLASGEQAHRYDWLTNGVKSGSLEVVISDDGTRTTRFEYNDRGRGPDIEEIARLDAHGGIVQLDISGHSYMGAEIDEHLRRDDSGQHWNSTQEKGTSTDTEALYLANNGTPERTADLARGLLASPSNSQALLPSGTASIAMLRKLEVMRGVSRRDVSLYAISGLGVQPEFIWLDDQLELFGVARGSSTLVPAGMAQVSLRMQEAQSEAEFEYYAGQTKPLTHMLPGRYTINNVHIVNVETGRVDRDRAVTVAGGKIETVSESTPTPGEHVIDGMGGWLIPGLWDMHTHLSLSQGVLHMAAGVTTVRDMGNNPEQYFDVKRRFDKGSVLGPRTFAAGIVERKSPYSAPIKALAESLDDALGLVDQYAQMGYPQIKIYSSIEPGWIRPIAERAHGHGMRLSGHIPSFMTAEQAVRDGFDEIQHVNMLFLNFLAGPQDDTRTPVRFQLVAEQGSELDLESTQVRNFVDLLRQHEVTIDPTIAIFDNMFRHRSGQLSPSYAMVAERLPPSMRRTMLAGRMSINDENAERYAASADALLSMVRLLHEAGIKIVAGTDALPGFTLHRELELYVKAGIPPVEVLRLATLGSAEHMGQGGLTGSLSPGKQADMVLLSANPLEDISAVRSASLVFKGDRYFKSAQIYRAVGITPF